MARGATLLSAPKGGLSERYNGRARPGLLDSPQRLCAEFRPPMPPVRTATGSLRLDSSVLLRFLAYYRRKV